MKAVTNTIWEAIRLFTVIRREPARFTVYSFVNILAGALGLLAPIAAGLYLSPDLPLPRHLTDVLRDGNGYTFALALLTASGAFLLNDLIGRKKTSYVNLRIVAGCFAIGLLLFLAFYSGMHSFAKLSQVASSGPAMPMTKSASTGYAWTNRETWQAWLTAIAVAYAIWLFCLQHVDDHEDYYKDLRDNRDKLIRRSKAATVGSGIEA